MACWRSDIYGHGMAARCEGGVHEMLCVCVRALEEELGARQLGCAVRVATCDSLAWDRPVGARVACELY